MKKILILVFGLFLTSSINAQVGIGTTTPAEDAILELDDSTKALLLTRVADINAIANPVNGMIVYDELNECIRGYEGGEWSDCFNGTEAVNGVSFPVSFVHCDTVNPTEVVDVINPTTGETWMDRNMGASQVATSSNDTSAYGDLYQWGRFAEGHQCRNSTRWQNQATTTDPLTGADWDGKYIEGHSNWLNYNDVSLWQGVNGENNPCPSGFRIPTETELDEERQSWSSSDPLGAFDSPLKFTTAGRKLMGGGYHSTIALCKGCYWSSTVSVRFGDPVSKYLHMGPARVGDPDGARMYSDSRALGLSIRCIKD